MSLEIGDPVIVPPAESTGGPLQWTAGQGPWVLYFYPKDNTPGCTTESAAFRDAYPDFQSAHATVLGISRDSLASHQRFKAKLGLPFELVSDTDEAWCNVFGVMQLKSMYGKTVRGIERSTFVIGSDGRLCQAWRGVKVPGHVDAVLAFVRSL